MTDPATAPLRVRPIRILSDNYVFVLDDGRSRDALVVDPGEAGPVLDFLDREGLVPAAVLLTHHHGDHVGGVAALVRRTPRLRVLGAARDRRRLPHVTAHVGEGDEVALLGRTARVLEVPGHTSGHIAWFFPDGAGGGDLFSGDTVFGGTIGNLFEGTPDDIFGSLVKIRALPPATRLWCAHEYTRTHVREAARFDPDNPRLAARLAQLEATDPARPTVPLTLEEERATNPFFRWDDEALVARLGTAPGRETFRRLCEVL
jgi:hydroxyacylglutathione hydrolase